MTTATPGDNVFLPSKTCCSLTFCSFVGAVQGMDEDRNNVPEINSTLINQSSQFVKNNLGEIPVLPEFDDDEM